MEISSVAWLLNRIRKTQRQSHGWEGLFLATITTPKKDLCLLKPIKILIVLAQEALGHEAFSLKHHIQQHRPQVTKVTTCGYYVRHGHLVLQLQFRCQTPQKSFNNDSIFKNLVSLFLFIRLNHKSDIRFTLLSFSAIPNGLKTSQLSKKANRVPKL